MYKISCSQSAQAVATYVRQPQWIEGSGDEPDALMNRLSVLRQSLRGQPPMRVKAELFACFLEHTRLAENPGVIFMDRIDHAGLSWKLRSEWQKEKERDIAPPLRATDAARSAGLLDGIADFSHTCPDWPRMLSLGVPGVIRALEENRDTWRAKGISAEQEDFYAGSLRAWRSVATLLRRMSVEGEKRAASPESRMACGLTRALAERAPETLAEALELIVLIYAIQTGIEGTQVRSLGRIDRDLQPFWQHDLEAGCPRGELEEVIRFFIAHFVAIDHPNNVPVCLGGAEGITEFGMALLDVYEQTGAYTPKVQIRVTGALPDETIMQIMDRIRRGHSSYVFISDEAVRRGLEYVGVSPADSDDYIPVGCYEPLVSGKELPCTCAGTLNLLKCVELALHNGRDAATGRQLGPKTGEAAQMATYEAFEAAVKAQIAAGMAAVERRVLAFEQIMPDVNPSPLFSGSIESCVRIGRDAYAGGMVYNTTSVNCIALANLVDSLIVVRRFVYEEKRVSPDMFVRLLDADWADDPLFLAQVRNLSGRYGSGSPEAAALARSFVDYCASLICGRPNGRGGVFRMGLFSIDWNISYGKLTAATPDGRRAGEALAKNLGAAVGMDRDGVTALISQAAGIDAAKAVNGCVLDVMLHPSAVQGRDGLKAITALLKAYCRQGGQAIQFNVFDAGTLRAAQAHPEQYATLQVRVCGWNACFVNLSRESQDLFIQQAEALEREA